jgi:hypothetical protein
MVDRKSSSVIGAVPVPAESATNPLGTLREDPESSLAPRSVAIFITDGFGGRVATIVTVNHANSVITTWNFKVTAVNPGSVLTPLSGFLVVALGLVHV